MRLYYWSPSLSAIYKLTARVLLLCLRILEQSIFVIHSCPLSPHLLAILYTYLNIKILKCISISVNHISMLRVFTSYHSVAMMLLLFTKLFKVILKAYIFSSLKIIMFFNNLYTDNS